MHTFKQKHSDHVMFKYTRLVQGEKLLKYVQILLLQRVIYMLEQQNIECYCKAEAKQNIYV